MRTSEQESLLLRSIVALRRSGLSHGDALNQASAGLPKGPLAARVNAARRALQAGTSSATDPLLASGSAPIDALEHAARSIDAQLSADSARAMTQHYLTLMLVGPLVLGAVFSWLFSDTGIEASSAAGGLLAYLTAMLRFIGIPMAIGAAMLIRRTGDRIAPGAARIRQASRLLELAASDTDPMPVLTNDSDRTYFLTRLAQVGQPQAAAELAAEMVREGEGHAAMFRHLAPLAAAGLGVLGLAPILFLIFLPLLSQAAM